MIKKYTKGKIAVFIDAANILYSQQTLGWEVDYKKLIAYFKKNGEFVNAYFYSGKISKNQKQEKFFLKMQQLGYIVKTKEVKWIRDRGGKILKGKGNLDIELALDIAQTLASYDTLALLSGDSDFEVVIDLVKRSNKRVIVISSRGHVSKELIKSAYKYIPLETLKGELKRDK